jgi:hypothetical protein
MPLILKIWIVLRWLTNHTLSLIRRHPRFSEWLLLGFMGAFILTPVPLIGHFLGTVALIISIILGISAETRKPNELSYRK